MKVIPATAVSPDKSLDQFFKLTFMSSDRIHDAFVCREKGPHTCAIDWRCDCWETSIRLQPRIS